MNSSFQDYQADRRYEGRRRAWRRAAFYLALIIACCAFWLGVLAAAAGVVH